MEIIAWILLIPTQILFYDCHHRDHSGYRLSQWEEPLRCNTCSHWLSPYPEWSLHPTGTIRIWLIISKDNTMVLYRAVIAKIWKLFHRCLNWTKIICCSPGQKVSLYVWSRYQWHVKSMALGWRALKISAVRSRDWGDLTHFNTSGPSPLGFDWEGPDASRGTAGGHSGPPPPIKEPRDWFL